MKKISSVCLINYSSEYLKNLFNVSDVRVANKRMFYAASHLKSSFGVSVSDIDFCDDSWRDALSLVLSDVHSFIIKDPVLYYKRLNTNSRYVLKKCVLAKRFESEIRSFVQSLWG